MEYYEYDDYDGYDQYGAPKTKEWYFLDDLEKQNMDFYKLRRLLENKGFEFVKNNPKLDHLIEISVDSFMQQNKIDSEYSNYIYSHFFDTYITFEEYYDTYVERINEKEINVTEADITKATEYIKRGIICCAVEIGSYLLNGDFETNVSIERLTSMANHHYQEYIHGKPLDYKLVTQFINSMITRLNEELEDRGLTKNEVIGVLGPYSFPETAGKRFSPTSGIFDYSFCHIDYDPDSTVRMCLSDIGLENVMFSKEGNKRVFKVKEDRFGYTSMNSGHWIPKANITSDEKVKEFIDDKKIKYDDIIFEEEKSTHR